MDSNKVVIFTKMHGAGNDYIYINCLDGCAWDLPALSREMSPRHTSVGADGIICITASEVADFGMRIFNADGSEAQMCGNGSRCVGKYVFDKGLTDKRRISLETGAGIKHLELYTGPDGLVSEVTVDMGIPEIDAEAVPVVCDSPRLIDAPVATSADGELRLTAVSMGNPHGVVIVDSIDALHFDITGPELERHQMWPERANIEFVEVLSPTELRMRVWERGSGETMACGTGACAAAVAAILQGLCDRRVTVHLRGGDLTIEWGDDSHVYMRGEAVTVYEGTYSPTLKR